MQILDADHPTSLEHEPRRLSGRAHLDIRARERRHEIRRGGTLSSSIQDVLPIEPGDALGLRAVEVVPRVRVESEFHGCGEKRSVTRVWIKTIADREHALGTCEQQQQIVEAPSGIAERQPAVEARPTPADVGHRVDDARTAVGLASWEGDPPLLQSGFGLGRVVPVVPRAHERDPSPRSDDQRIGFTRDTGFEDQNANGGIGGEPVSERAAGRARADDDVVGLENAQCPMLNAEGSTRALFSRTSSRPRLRA